MAEWEKYTHTVVIYGGCSNCKRSWSSRFANSPGNLMYMCMALSAGFRTPRARQAIHALRVWRQYEWKSPTIKGRRACRQCLTIYLYMHKEAIVITVFWFYGLEPYYMWAIPLSLLGASSTLPLSVQNSDNFRRELHWQCGFGHPAQSYSPGHLHDLRSPRRASEWTWQGVRIYGMQFQRNRPHEFPDNFDSPVALSSEICVDHPQILPEPLPTFWKFFWRVRTFSWDDFFARTKREQTWPPFRDYDVTYRSVTIFLLCVQQTNTASYLGINSFLYFPSFACIARPDIITIGFSIFMHQSRISCTITKTCLKKYVHTLVSSLKKQFWASIHTF